MVLWRTRVRPANSISFGQVHGVERIIMHHHGYLVGPKKHVFDGMNIGATCRIRLKCAYAAAMRPYVKLL